MSTGDADHGASHESSPQAVAALADVSAAVDVLAAAPVWQLGDTELGDALRGLESVQRRVDAVRLSLLQQAESRDAVGPSSPAGAVSTAGWLRAHLQQRPGRARADVALAGALTSRWPRLQAALASGTASLDQVRVCVAALEDLPSDLDTGTVERAERFLVEQCAHLDPNRLARLGKHLLHVLDPDGPELLEREEAKARESRELRITPTRTGVRLRGHLDAEAGAVLMSALDPLAAPSTALDARGPSGLDPRSRAGLLADALVELAHRALGAGDLPTQGRERPHVTVTLDHATLVRAVGAMGADLDHGAPVSAETARRIACDCQVIPVVLGGRGEPLDVGREQRTVPRHMRRALVARDRHCAFPGCDRPPAWCEGHHVVHWADGGETKIDNLALLCRRHHTVIHHGRWRVRIHDGRPVFTDPDGTEHLGSAATRRAVEQLALPPPDPDDPAASTSGPPAEPRGP